MAKYLLVVADDFGACPQIDEGILQSIEHGHIDCVDVFVTFPNAEDDIRTLHEKIQQKNLKMGLHLTLTVGSPVVTDHDEDFLATALRPGSTFFRPIREQIIGKAVDNGKRDTIEEHLDSIRKEIEAQLDRFEEIVGKKPDHVSCHEGFFHLTDKLTRVYLDIALERNLFIRHPSLISLTGPNSWIEKTEMQETALKNAPRVIRNNGVIQGFGMCQWSKKKDKLLAMVNDYRSRGLRTTDYFVDAFFGNGRDHILKAILNRMESGSYEMVVHPVTYGKFNGFETPVGIDKESFKHRKTETITLSKPEIATYREQWSIERYTWI